MNRTETAPRRNQRVSYYPKGETEFMASGWVTKVAGARWWVGSVELTGQWWCDYDSAEDGPFTDSLDDEDDFDDEW